MRLVCHQGCVCSAVPLRNICDLVKSEPREHGSDRHMLYASPVRPSSCRAIEQSQPGPLFLQLQPSKVRRFKSILVAGSTQQGCMCL